ncbi:Uncharacterised protein [Mycobacterium tuberculosis]|nr:Uncharacterised protein [Mycobacterium tuberculosis]
MPNSRWGPGGDRSNRRDRSWISEGRALLRRQRDVLRLDDGNLHLQLALFVLQIRSYRGSLLGRGPGIGRRFGCSLLGLDGLFSSGLETGHLRGHLMRHHPLYR